MNKNDDLALFKHDNMFDFKYDKEGVEAVQLEMGGYGKPKMT